MPRRDWDKLKRQQKVQAPLSRAQWRDRRWSKKAASRRRFHKGGIQLRRRQEKNVPFRSNPKPENRSSLPTVERILRVWSPFYPDAILSRWRRTKGQWRCLVSDEPFDWFTRLQHAEIAGRWLREHNYNFEWQPIQPACAAHNPQAEDRPGVPKIAASTPSLNNATQAEPRNDQSPNRPGLEQNGLTSPRCLMPEGCPSELKSSP